MIQAGSSVGMAQPGMGTSTTASTQQLQQPAGTSVPQGVQPSLATSAVPGPPTATPVKRKSSKKSSKGGGGRWTKEEDQKLRAAVAAVGPQNWKLIATEYLNDQRSDVQCLHRWQKVLQPGLVKGPWTKEEDQIIIDCIEAGITKWSEIAERIPGRIGKQCRERWFNHLDPSLKKGGWTEEEDAVLVEAQAKWGNSWTKIAKLLPGRSENAVKNRWNSATRRRQKAQTQTPEHIVKEAQDKVLAAEQAEREAELLRMEQNSSMRDEEDTECVPRSAVELLRARRQEQLRIEAEQRGEEPPAEPPKPVPPPIVPKPNPNAILPNLPVPPGMELPLPGKKGSGASTSASQLASTSSTQADGSSMPASAAADGRTGKEKGSRRTKQKGKSKEKENKVLDPNDLDDASMELLMNDQTLTLREKELIHKAYLAGIAQSGPPTPKGKGERKKGMKVRLRRNADGSLKQGSKAGHAGANHVQWDFQADNPQSSGATSSSNIPVDFLREHGIEFDLAEIDSPSTDFVSGLSHFAEDDRVGMGVDIAGFGLTDVEPSSLIADGGTAPDDDDDLELSTSLLNMSLDKDIPMDELALSMGDAAGLDRQDPEGAMAAIAQALQHMPSPRTAFSPQHARSPSSAGGYGAHSISPQRSSPVSASQGTTGEPRFSTTTVASTSAAGMTAGASASSLLQRTQALNRDRQGPSYSPSGPLSTGAAAGQLQFSIDVNSAFPPHSGMASPNAPLARASPSKTAHTSGQAPPPVRTSISSRESAEVTTSATPNATRAGSRKRNALPVAGLGGQGRSPGWETSPTAAMLYQLGGDQLFDEHKMDGKMPGADPGADPGARGPNLSPRDGCFGGMDPNGSGDLTELVSNPNLFWSLVSPASSLSPNNLTMSPNGAVFKEVSK